MKLKTTAEDWLLAMLWGADKLLCPSWSKLFEPYDWWEYKRGLRHHVRHLEERQLVKREKRAGQIVHRVTELGRLRALGGRDPQQQWQRRWDGQWRLILFDLPVSQKTIRLRLWRWLIDNGFGYLQQSVWVHPDPVEEVTDALKSFRDDVECFTIMEARCYKGYSDKAVVEAAWDFDEINRRYRACMEVATVTLSELRKRQPTPAARLRWLSRERASWQYAVSADPLLPRALWPSGYLGEKAWRARSKALTAFVSDLTAAAGVR
jgi:phenylacetic acid degradation operon negative regulatory protein